MNTIQDIASHLHRIQADSRGVWGDESHDATPEYPCSNCGGEVVDMADRCWQYHLSRLITGTNPFKYLNDTRLD